MAERDWVGNARLSMFFVLLVLSYFAALSDGKSPCDPLVPEYCLLPFPNSYYLQLNSSTVTGYKVNFESDSFPVDSFGRLTSPVYWNTFDGFSTFPSILAYFPNLSIHNFPRHWDVVQSLSDQSPSVIVNADTGEKVPHWAELDDNLLFIENRTLMIWPAVPLEDSVHYVIGLRSLVDTLGGVIPPSDAFKCLR
jgi:hypothetical protein